MKVNLVNIVSWETLLLLKERKDFVGTYSLFISSNLKQMHCAIFNSINIVACYLQGSVNSSRDHILFSSIYEKFTFIINNLNVTIGALTDSMP